MMTDYEPVLILATGLGIMVAVVVLLGIVFHIGFKAGRSTVYPVPPKAKKPRRMDPPGEDINPFHQAAYYDEDGNP